MFVMIRSGFIERILICTHFLWRDWRRVSMVSINIIEPVALRCAFGISIRFRHFLLNTPYRETAHPRSCIQKYDRWIIWIYISYFVLYQAKNSNLFMTFQIIFNPLGFLFYTLETWPHSQYAFKSERQILTEYQILPWY